MTDAELEFEVLWTIKAWLDWADKVKERGSTSDVRGVLITAVKEMLALNERKREKEITR